MATLGGNDRIEVELKTEGCYHRDRRRLVIRGGAKPSAAVFPVELENEFGLVGGAGGTIDLSPEWVARLDQALHRYRQLPAWEENCSARDDISLHWVTSKGRADESHTDDPCFRPGDTSGPFWEIVFQVNGESDDPPDPDPQTAAGDQQE